MTCRLGNFFSAAVLLLFTSTMLLLAILNWEYSAKVLQFPLMSGSLLILCAVWLAIRSFTATEQELIDESEVFSEGNRRCSLFRRVLWLGVIFPLGYVFGFIAGLLAFSFAYTGYHGLPWWQRLLTGFVIFAVVYIGFYKLLGVPLPIEPMWMRD
ncbi:tripartite tricarboxylate transporter TctB family protein [Marinobacter sp. TBZ242]|uniref:Tripartite tricarboxylate transporter TctB family protein n=1 Tax=Marinobacter azerbaijanicus TaxID=3050455 RepID=A0ABT7IGK1_9GAMM|nr:tripartite tricarboxylate transporter TctB family protein [Marinobacter sp. TBZ242]MDL0433270.1 tripartite tricarboxylate transporter TctB family protein [Marinobacter sp. TBZ242]